MRLKNLIPQYLRLQCKIFKRNITDRKNGAAFADSYKQICSFEYTIATMQTIRQSDYFQNKIDNIKLGAKLIEEYVIKPGEIFSFWKSVGNPTSGKGFKIGRNLIAGKLQADYGGGLCQLSGIIYINALKAGLTVTERHNHTVDIYTDDERFTPLGSDATVVYGYKDLRVINPYPFDLKFGFEIQDSYITCYLLSTEHIPERNLEFRTKKYFSKVIVETFADNINIASSEYII